MLDRRDFLHLSGATLLGVTHSLSGCAQKDTIVFAGFREGEKVGFAGISLRNGIIYRNYSDGRIHGFASHPESADAVAFLRSPAKGFQVFEKETGKIRHISGSASGRHIYGHGTYSRDGSTLFVAENHIKSASGIIGVYDAHLNYRRTGEFECGGIGPHEIRTLQQSDTLVVAVGGKKTRPETGRAILNIDSLQSGLAYIKADTGEIEEIHYLDRDNGPLSLRHIDISSDDQVVFAMQFYGPQNLPRPMVGYHSRPGKLKMISLKHDISEALRNYCGSVKLDQTGKYLLVSSPRGSTFVVADMKGDYQRRISHIDGCGVLLAQNKDLVFSGGDGRITTIRDPQRDHPRQRIDGNISWDNHLG